MSLLPETHFFDQSILQDLVRPLYAPFGPRAVGVDGFDAQLSASAGKLRFGAPVCVTTDISTLEKPDRSEARNTIGLTALTATTHKFQTENHYQSQSDGYDESRDKSIHLMVRALRVNCGSRLICPLIC